MYILFALLLIIVGTGIWKFVLENADLSVFSKEGFGIFYNSFSFVKKIVSALRNSKRRKKKIILNYFVIKVFGFIC